MDGRTLMAEQMTSAIYTTLVGNARKFRESAPNQIPIFEEPSPRVGVSEHVWFFKFKPGFFFSAFWRQLRGVNFPVN